ncbi:replication initiator [Mycolicibacterium aubagnense]|uniref:replication initiator n=1 Tax=Mycolicibacterium aubagnense TaxID=319707 RepID=UPI003B8A6D77
MPAPPVATTTSRQRQCPPAGVSDVDCAWLRRRAWRHTGQPERCIHGKLLSCNHIHDHTDPLVGQPLCGPCYDYLSHVLFFSWHLPEPWRRFTIALRRAVRQELKVLGCDLDSVRVSFVKVVEKQARAVPHIHALIRLDPANDETTASRSPSRTRTGQLLVTPFTLPAMRTLLPRLPCGSALRSTLNR